KRGEWHRFKKILLESFESIQAYSFDILILEAKSGLKMIKTNQKQKESVSNSQKRSKKAKNT
ncbi:MAG: hypothetical protein ACI4U2_02060, partial [Christensenellaceae bacterium]